MTFSDFIPYVAKCVGIAPGTLLFLMFATNQAAKVIGRRIPNDATGFWANLRMICVIIGADPSSVVTSGVTVQDVAAQAATTQPVKAKVEAATGQPIPSTIKPE